LGDLENIGKTVLKAVYYARNVEINKRMLRELSIDADTWYINEETTGDSDGDGSSSSESEDEKIAESEKLKNALDEASTLP
jgi:hypothetical protein